MNDLRTLTAQPQSLTIDGETYMVHPLDLNDWGALQAWLEEQHTCPLEAAKATIAKGGFNIAQQQFLMEKALEKKVKPVCPLGSIEADELLTSMKGYAQVLYLAIRKGRPGFTESDAAELAMKLAAIDTTKVGQITTLNMVVSDPKDEPLNVTPPLKKSGSAASRSRKKAASRTGGPSSTSC